MRIRRLGLDFWAEDAMLDIGKFEKAFGNFPEGLSLFY